MTPEQRAADAINGFWATTNRSAWPDMEKAWSNMKKRIAAQIREAEAAAVQVERERCLECCRQVGQSGLDVLAGANEVAELIEKR